MAKEEFEARYAQLPNEVYVNVSAGKLQEDKVELELSDKKLDDKSVTYIRQDFFEKFLTETTKKAQFETEGAVELCTKTIDIMRSVERVSSVKTYFMAVLFVVAGLFLRGLELSLALLSIVLLSIVLTVLINKAGERRFTQAVAERLKKREEQENEQGKQNS